MSCVHFIPQQKNGFTARDSRVLEQPFRSARTHTQYKPIVYTHTRIYTKKFGTPFSHRNKLTEAKLRARASHMCVWVCSRDIDAGGWKVGGAEDAQQIILHARDEHRATNMLNQNWRFNSRAQNESSCFNGRARAASTWPQNNCPPPVVVRKSRQVILAVPTNTHTHPHQLTSKNYLQLVEVTRHEFK